MSLRRLPDKQVAPLVVETIKFTLDTIEERHQAM